MASPLAVISKITPEAVPPPFSIRTTPGLVLFIIATRLSDPVGVGVGIAVGAGIGVKVGAGVAVGTCVGTGVEVGTAD